MHFCYSKFSLNLDAWTYFWNLLIFVSMIICYKTKEESPSSEFFLELIIGLFYFVNFMGGVYSLIDIRFLARYQPITKLVTISHAMWILYWTNQAASYFLDIHIYYKTYYHYVDLFVIYGFILAQV
jgi:hypothetical protein